MHFETHLQVIGEASNLEHSKDTGHPQHPQEGKPDVPCESQPAAGSHYRCYPLLPLSL